MDHTILAVDDEENVLRALNRVFRQEPFRFVTANGGEAALKEINAGLTPTLVISDQRMPGMSGSEFLSRVKELLPDTMRIILTGHGDLESAIAAINDGEVYRYILKPWGDDDLRLVVRSCIERYELIAENRQLTEALFEKNRQLEELSSALDEMVSERNRALEMKVRQLEGRDRILQHLLQVHPLEETLTTVLEVLRDAAEAERAVIHLLSDGSPEPGAVLEGGEVTLDDDRLSRAKLDADALETYGESLVSDTVTTPDGGQKVFAIPVRRGELSLGLIEITFAEVVGTDVVEAVEGYAQQAGIAICDSRMNQDLNTWQAALDDTLEDLA